MSDVRSMIEHSVERLFADLMQRDALEAHEQGQASQEIWARCSEAGLERAMASEGHGGIGATPAEAYPILRGVGYHALSAPVADTLMATWLLSRAGLAAPPGPIALAGGVDAHPLEERENDGEGLVRGSLPRVAWASAADRVLVSVGSQAQTRLLLVDLARPGTVTRTPRPNAAGEACADLQLHDAPIAAQAQLDEPHAEDALLRAGALARSAQMVGALERVLELSIRYAGERVQFGKPIGRNQAIQQSLAALAGQVAAARSATLAAYDAGGRNAFDATNAFDVAAAKLLASAAAGAAASTAHQVHGAIGFTHEHVLHFYTRRLWSWRDEFGTEAFWAHRLGRAAIDAGADRFWPALVQRELPL